MNNNADAILDILKETYPDAECGLNFESPYELLVATILSAQCTDVRVNIITQELFKEYDTPEKMLKLTEEELEEKIKSCGLYKNKSRNILAASAMLAAEYRSEVPAEMESLLKLPGVGRKTANVVLSNAFGVPAIAVDTHVFRVSNRLGISKGKTPEEVEKGLMKVVPKDVWGLAHHLLIIHGRRVCAARNPKCGGCPLAMLCEYYAKANDNKK
ncbi:MAG: endonuclease III [Clostridiaceae bacterium]